ncbi:MAG: glycosyl transferase family 28 protein [Rhodopirellula sp. JB055]|uniref:glycosyl transferase family 28 protein n=1 Tax=Rhodopirellula sp. JB055 TaxID=3342846 RepID=UPI00370B9C58
MSDHQPRVGFYTHYHGMGHKHRTEAILQQLSIPATVITSRLHQLDWSGPTLTNVIGIDCDNDDVPVRGMQHAQEVSALHHAPLWTDSITRRVAQYTRWLDKTRPDVMVVDVSAEISMLTRLASIPQIVMRQHGRRDDPAHLAAYEAAHSLLAPFPESMEDDITPDFVRDKTIYLDGFCRQQTIESSNQTQRTKSKRERPTIVVMFGRGGTGDVHQHLRDAATLVSHADWVVLGKDDDSNSGRTPANLFFAGWQNLPNQWIANASVVVTSAGHNCVMELGHVQCRFIAIAEDRPFEEQIRKAKVLGRERLAIGLTAWPAPSQWPTLIDEAMSLDPSPWRNVFEHDGAEQAAKHITEVAHWSHEARMSRELLTL